MHMQPAGDPVDELVQQLCYQNHSYELLTLQARDMGQ
jgi:hypothetical protein